MDVDPGVSTNRTVYTFVGSPDDVIQGALAAARVAHKLIDMRVQKGEHPRIGLNLTVESDQQQQKEVFNFNLVK